MGAKIEVESEHGVGSTFHFTVPLETRMPTSPLRGDGFADLAGGLAVLVLSDSTINQDLLVEVLANSSMHPRFAETMDQAFAALAQAKDRNEKFGLVILDLRDGGLEAAFEIRRECLGTPMILLTPSGQRGDAARCRELEIGGYLTGPVVASDLADTIQAVLAGTPDLITRYWLREHRRSLSVLVADDSSTNRLLAARLLEKRGHHVVGAENGAEAVRALEQRDFDIVLMDVHMPLMDGYEAARQIRLLEGHRSLTPIVALTGSVNDEGRKRCLDAGMNHFIGKPFRVEDLLEIIDELTAGSVRKTSRAATARSITSVTDGCTRLSLARRRRRGNRNQDSRNVEHLDDERGNSCNSQAKLDIEERNHRDQRPEYPCKLEESFRVRECSSPVRRGHGRLEQSVEGELGCAPGQTCRRRQCRRRRQPENHGGNECRPRLDRERGHHHGLL